MPSEDASVVPASVPQSLRGLGSHSSRKVIHISMEDYVPRPLDLITDPWVTDADAR